MEHLEFVNKLDSLGVSIHANNQENKEREFDVGNGFSNQTIIQRNFQLSYKDKSLLNNEPPITKLVAKAIDFGSWKHSWHNEIIPDNYSKLSGIIQNLIIERAEAVDELMAIYFQLQHEMSLNESNTNDNPPLL